jgi:integrase/recombinase XerD
MNLCIVESIQEVSVIDEFINNLDVKASSRETYAKGIRQFFKWTRSAGYNIADIDRRHILEYKTFLINTRSIRTASGYLNCVRQFYTYAESIKAYPNVAKSIRAPKRDNVYSRQPLTADQARELLKYYNVLQCKRDYAIVSILLYCGLRTAELVGMNIGDVTTLNGRPAIFVKKKGSDVKDSVVGLPVAVHQALNDYMNESHTSAKVSDPLFVSQSNNGRQERITTRSIRRIIKEGLRSIGIDDVNISAHSLRHTGATLVMEATGDIEAVRMWCRHQNANTTQIYVHTLQRSRAIENRAYDVLSGIFSA